MKAGVLFRKTLPFSLAKLVLGGAMVLILGVLMALFLGIGYLFGDWKIPWTEDPAGLQPMELQRTGHD